MEDGDREEDQDQDDDEDGDDEKGGEGVKARPEWASPAFSILVSAPLSSLLAQVPTAIASKCDKNVTKDLKSYFASNGDNIPSGPG